MTRRRSRQRTTIEDEARLTRKNRHNERIKLLATMLNSLAVGMGTTGIVGPIVALFLQHPDAPLSGFSISSETLIFMGVWSAIGFILHLAAQFVLGLLR